jgi:CRISPR-associated endonuclease/helicase Cas3
MILAGLTTVADWIGSNQAFFPPAGNRSNHLDDSPERVRRYVEDAQSQAGAALERLGWLRTGEDLGDRPPFEELFRYLPLGEVRPLQAAADRSAASLDKPGLVLIESPMGEGKTEAALCLADAWERRGGQGLYVALPTMATSNGMFGRLKTFLGATYPGRLNLHLLHGQALLSEAYQQLVVNSEDETLAAETYDEDRSPSAVVADSWFASDRKHGLLAPFAVGTIDQALLSVLQVRHGFVRLFGLAGKTVILDEVHAYDIYMSTLLQRLLQWLGALGCPVVLLSATLPQRKRQELLDAYTGRALPPESEGARYPRLTVVRPDASPPVVAEHIRASSEKVLRLTWKERDLKRLATGLAEALADGGCAAVIRNTVGLAQQTYQALKESLPPDVKVELFHARFPFGRRQDIENGVLKLYGKEGPRPLKAVLVATQVIEQSLDLDFDLLVSDVAPVDLILQRAGRLWRHQRLRLSGLKEPTVWLLRPALGADEVPDFGSGELIYERFVLLKSYLALQNGGSVSVPGELEGLIESVYGDGRLPAHSPAWEAALAAAKKAMVDKEREDSQAAKSPLVASPVDEDEILYRPNRQLEEDNPDLSRAHQALTRLVQPSVSLIILYEIDGNLFLDPDGRHSVRLDRRPNLERTRAFLRNAVTVHQKDCVFHYLKEAPPSGWRKSGLLRFHRVVRVDRQGKFCTGEYPLLVEHNLGVLFLNEKERDE